MGSVFILDAECSTLLKTVCEAACVRATQAPPKTERYKRHLETESKSSITCVVGAAEAVRACEFTAAWRATHAKSHTF